MRVGALGSVCAATVLLTGCFSPDDPPAVEGSTDGPSTGGTPTSTATTAEGGDTTAASDPTATTGGEEGSTSAADGSSSTGVAIPEWGEGDPPDFGDLGDAGEGAVLAVHALSTSDAVDVWLVGDAAPVATAIAPGDAERIEGIGRDARRVVFTRSGTTEAVGCSQWFPLRAGEQWAVVAARAEHTCPSPVEGGATMTFEQALELSENPVRFVHAAAADALTVLRGQAPEPGALEPLETLGVTALPNCKASGCSVDYVLEAPALDLARNFSFFTQEVSQIPPAGEVLFVVRGDVREDWPNESAAMRLVMVDIEGRARLLERDPEIAFLSGPSFSTVDWVGTGGPVAFPIATTGPCQDELCLVPSLRLRPGSFQLNVSPQGGSPVSGGFDLEAGRRYVLAFDGELTLVTDTFSRDDEDVATALGLNMDVSQTLTLGRRFNDMAQAFAPFTDIPATAVSDAGDVPADDWSMISARGAQPLGADCFRPVSTPPGWRGLLTEEAIVHLDVWPPTQDVLGLLCF